MITTKNKIGYIQRRYDENNIPKFKFVVAKIKKVVIGKTKTSVYSDKFYTLDAEELESNTKCIDTSKGLLLVNEPFIVKDEEINYFNAVVDNWNETSPKGIFDE